MAKAEERLLLKIGIWTSEQLFTRKQAERHALRVMDPALKRCGFEVFVSRSDAEMHGGTWFRASYGYSGETRRRA